MARIFEDGFDHYGDDEANMRDGVYANVQTGNRAVLSTTYAATGTHSFHLGAGDFSQAQPQLRKSLPSATDKLGAMAHFYFDSLPSNNTKAMIFSFLTSSSQEAHLSVIVNTNGGLGFYRGTQFGTTSFYSPGTLIAESDPVLVPSAWNHVEVQVYVHDTLGWVRAAVNGIHVYEATGLDTKFGTSSITGVGNQGSPGEDFWMDNYIIYDFTGDSAVDTDFCPTTDGSGIATNYIGELQVMWMVPNADTSEDDWTPSTGSDAYAMVDETTPNDADYISSTTAGDLTELALTDLPPEITYIRGLTVWGRMSKSDAGSALIRFGMKSVADVYDAPERPVTVEPTYWWDQVNVDPDSGARWTRASFNAAWSRLTRSA